MLFGTPDSAPRSLVRTAFVLYRFGTWSNKEVDFLNTLQLLTAKPSVYLVNLNEKDFIRKKNKWLPKIFEWVKVR